MTRLINADELKESIHKKTLFSEWQKVLIDTVIDDQPTVNAVPVVHGRWLPENRTMDYFWVCSVCKFPSEAHGAFKLYKYCPNCGARMDEE